MEITFRNSNRTSHFHREDAKKAKNSLVLLETPKKIILYFGILFWAAGAVDASGLDKQKSAALADVRADYLKTVEPLFRQSCFDCHSAFTQYPWYHSLPLASGLIDRDVTAARKKLDMSDGYPFKGKANPESDLKAIAFQLEGKKMPPWQYRIMHGKSSLSPSQIQAVEDWTARSLDRLDRAGW